MSNIIGALILIVIGILGLIAWWVDFGMVLRGLIPFALIIFGLLIIGSKYYNQEKTETE